MEPEMLDCGHMSTPTQLTVGYGIDADGKRHCYACCAVRDRAQMEEAGKATLYLVEERGKRPEITNWPGSLRFPAGPVRKGRHNIAGTRYDTWFDGPGGTWHAVQYGENTQIAHCKRVKG